MLVQYMQIKKGGEKGGEEATCTILLIAGTLNQPSIRDNIHARVHT